MVWVYVLCRLSAPAWVGFVVVAMRTLRAFSVNLPTTGHLNSDRLNFTLLHLLRVVVLDERTFTGG